MKNVRVRTSPFLLLLIALWGVPGQAAAAELTVFAASSLTEVLQPLVAAFEQETGRAVRCHFAGSQVLRFQLEQGAPADVVALADPLIMAALTRQRLVVAPRIFARNRLQLVVSPYAADRLRHFADLALPDTLVVIGHEQVPVGRYTRQLLNQLGDAALSARILRNVVSEEASVKGVVSKVLLGEADAGFVYATDLTPRLQEEGATVIALPHLAAAPVAVYPVAVTTISERPAAARAFVDFLLAPRGQAILRERNFLPGGN